MVWRKASVVGKSGGRILVLAAFGMLSGALAGCAALTSPPGADTKSAPIVAVAGTPVVVSVPAAGAAPGTTPPAPSPASPAKPFAEVIKDAKVMPGYFTLYQKDEKVYRTQNG